MSSGCFKARRTTLPEEAVFQLTSEESGLGEEGGRGCGGGICPCGGPVGLWSEACSKSSVKASAVGATLEGGRS